MLTGWGSLPIKAEEGKNAHFFDKVVDKERRRWKVRLYSVFFGLDLPRMKKNISKVFSYGKSKVSLGIHVNASFVEVFLVKFVLNH